jgi:hypothetical protein
VIIPAVFGWSRRQLTGGFTAVPFALMNGSAAGDEGNNVVGGVTVKVLSTAVG